MIKKIWLLLLVPLYLCAQEQAVEQDKWKSFRFFIGNWEGAASGQSGYGKGKRTYKLILNEKYLYCQNSVVYRAEEGNPAGELHEDWTMFSWDMNRSEYVAHQFNSEGFINHFILDSVNTDSTSFMFVTEIMENIPEGFKARLSYIIQNENEFTEKFELAPPNQPFQPYQQNYWKRTP